MNEVNTVNYNKEHYAVMANDVIRGKQTMSLQEARLIRLLIMQVGKDDTDFKTYKVNILDLANFLGIDSSNLYREIREICQSLMTRTIKIQKGNEWEIFQWLQLAKYDGKGTITLMLSNQIAPYLLQLKSWFTKYQLKNILAMKSFYSIRLYELLKLTIGEDRKKIMKYMFEVQYLRKFFECETKFKKIIDFKKYVLDIAVRDMSEYSEFKCTYECRKTGRTITEIIFFLEEKEKQQTRLEKKQEHQEQEIDPNSDDLIDQLRETIKEPLKTKEYKAILQAANNDLKLIEQKYQIAQKQRKIDNLVGWLIKAIQEEYTEPVEKKKRSGFNNIEPREYNYAELEKELLGYSIQKNDENLKKEL